MTGHLKTAIEVLMVSLGRIHVTAVLFNDNINTNVNTEVGRDAWLKCDMGGLAFSEPPGFVIIQLGF